MMRTLGFWIKSDYEYMLNSLYSVKLRNCAQLNFQLTLKFCPPALTISFLYTYVKCILAFLAEEIRTKINQESTISWEKFCTSISLESDPKKSWRKITDFLKPKGPRNYPTLKLGNITAKTNPEKAQLLAESVERNFGTESHLFSKSQFDRINKFVEAHSYHFTPLDSLYDNITDTDDDSDLVADVDPDTLIRIVRTELKNGKAPGIDNVYNIILK